MQIHKIECYPTLQISMNVRDGHPSPNICDFHVTESRFHIVFDGFVHLLVLFNTAKEVLLCLFRGHIGIIRIARGNFESDVRCNDRGVRTYRFEENDFQIRFLGHSLRYLLPVGFYSVAYLFTAEKNAYTGDFEYCSLHLLRVSA